MPSWAPSPTTMMASGRLWQMARWRGASPGILLQMMLAPSATTEDRALREDRNVQRHISTHTRAHTHTRTHTHTETHARTPACRHVVCERASRTSLMMLGHERLTCMRWVYGSRHTRVFITLSRLFPVLLTNGKTHSNKRTEQTAHPLCSLTDRLNTQSCTLKHTVGQWPRTRARAQTHTNTHKMPVTTSSSR